MCVYEIPEVTARPPLSYPRWGPWGGGPLMYESRLLFKLHAVAYSPLVACIVRLLFGVAQANLLCTVARIFLLWHLPRFPFHDSTGSGFLL